ncbi:bark storage protein A-like isoform X3 [Juglans microcarpa x Juglans regia]|nr:bark storage protein A-like isoform X3 [Juglans microcarpa x Juglans regia]XP_041012094.1 bark storage protein A-like isoform X3 [Juglans microcarpa x Juglans regia]
MTGEQTLNAGITVQILLDTFEIKAIVHYGTSGSANDSLNLGDVSIPNYVAFTGSWKWKEFKSAEGILTELKFGAFNLPEKGENLLATIEFTPQQLYSVEKPMEEIFWLPIEPKLFNISTKLQDIQLQQCVNETYCLPEAPKVVYGLRGSTADIYLDNAAYREFLFKEFNVSTVDEESAAIVMTSLSNGVPCIVFRGVSDLAGGDEKLSSTSLSSLAAVNALSVAVDFIGLFGEEAVINDQ